MRAWGCNACAARRGRTSMAKSVPGAGWLSFAETCSAYKAIAVRPECRDEVRPKSVRRVALCPRRTRRGIADLGIRQWLCVHWRSEHDLDLNGALNLLCALRTCSASCGNPRPL